MNVSGFDDDSGNQSFVNNTDQHISQDWETVDTVHYVIWYVTLMLGIPGNILSATVWLRRQVADKNSSAVYLAVLAINDLVFLISRSLYRQQDVDCFLGQWFCDCCGYLGWTTEYLEPLLVLSFSAERLIAILHPLKVPVRFVCI